MGRFASVAKFPSVASPDSADNALGQWLNARCGKLTASDMWKACDYLQSGKPSQKRKDYMLEKLGERLTGVAARHFVTAEMQWGLDHEAEAKDAFRELTGFKLNGSGWYEHDLIENFGATPDDEVGTDAFLEVKCPTTENLIQWRIDWEIPDKYRAQMLAQLACGRRVRCHFFAYDPRIKDKKLNHFYQVFEPNGEKILGIEKEASKFLQELDDLFDAFVTAGS